MCPPTHTYTSHSISCKHTNQLSFWFFSTIFFRSYLSLSVSSLLVNLMTGRRLVTSSINTQWPSVPFWSFTTSAVRPAGYLETNVWRGISIGTAGLHPMHINGKTLIFICFAFALCLSIAHRNDRRVHRRNCQTTWFLLNFRREIQFINVKYINTFSLFTSSVMQLIMFNKIS